MLSRVEDPRRYVTESTDSNGRSGLRAAGLVHVTGLQPFVPGSTDRRPPIGANTKNTECGRWDENNGRFCIVTTGGEFWLGQAIGPGHPNSGTRKATTSVMAPRGKGCFVPCSNGEDLPMSDILERLADPDWMPE